MHRIKFYSLSAKCTRAVPCPNCGDRMNMTYGGQLICNACGGKGRVMCHTCFSKYGDNPNDIKMIRKIMDQTLDYAKVNNTTFSFQIWQPLLDSITQSLQEVWTMLHVPYV